jgi:hypothetical protein
MVVMEVLAVAVVRTLEPKAQVEVEIHPPQHPLQIQTPHKVIMAGQETIALTTVVAVAVLVRLEIQTVVDSAVTVQHRLLLAHRLLTQVAVVAQDYLGLRLEEQVEMVVAGMVQSQVPLQQELLI